ncbi:MAG: YheC/YheD family protein [Turicibacter sp.]
MGVEFIYFRPEDVNLLTRQINGLIFFEGKWIKESSPFPQVIINAGSPAKLKKHSDVMRVLRKEIPFTSFPVGNKLDVYNRLKKSEVFSPYLIPTKSINSVKDVYQFLNTYSKVIFKPIDGHQGENVFLIEKTAQGYLVDDKAHVTLYSQNEFYFFINQKITHKKYLIQAYINSKTVDGYSFDIRLHIVKNSQGLWDIPVLFPRISSTKSVVTNTSSGGTYLEIDEFLAQNYANESSQAKKYLERFAIELSNYLDQLQIQKGDHVFDELGIDIGIDEEHHIWIYEVNWRPGFIYPNEGADSSIATNLLGYALYIANIYKK